MRPPTYASPVPAGIGIPDSVHTRLGTLRFDDGVPDEATAALLFDQLDFQRAVQAFLAASPAASVEAIRRAIGAFGPDNRTVLIFETLMDSRSLFLTANNETVYSMAWLDLRDGPVVVEVPPRVLGLVDDHWFGFVADLGLAGADGGRGGSYLFVPPGYTGALPDGGFHVYRSATFGNWLVLRGFLQEGDPAPAVAALKERLRIYTYGSEPVDMDFVDVSGQPMNTIHSGDAAFFDEVNAVVQSEPDEASDPETLGLLASIGIERGRPFAPDERMQAILAEAAVVANAMARANAYRCRLEDAYLYPDSAWLTPFIGGSHEFRRNGARLLDARTLMFFVATGITPAMAVQQVGAGSGYAGAFVDSAGQPLDGARTYRLRLPTGIPATMFWSIVVYDTQTRSMLHTDQQFPSVGSMTPGLRVEPDGACELYFGPSAPNGHASNWVQTWPGKGWWIILRLYAPEQAWFDSTWRPGEIELLS
jgi:hypothetical protein